MGVGSVVERWRGCKTTQRRGEYIVMACGNRKCSGLMQLVQVGWVHLRAMNSATASSICLYGISRL